ncbi:host attachment family protein [Neotabrizicola sp. sgz301269]|uniref:host attachment family protein n=1 Tax=Neotabrizicola sp. sgz301269 TaxID=3276282 RepID=UPI0037700AB1
MLDKNALVVVADGEGAILFRNTERHGLKLETAEKLVPGDLADQGPSGSIPPDMDWQEQLEATFAKILTRRLNEMALKQEFEQILIVADPSTLGQMRPLYHKELEKRLVRDVPKTMTNSTTAEIERALAA